MPENRRHPVTLIQICFILLSLYVSKNVYKFSCARVGHCFPSTVEETVFVESVSVSQNKMSFFSIYRKRCLNLLDFSKKARKVQSGMSF